MVCIVYYKGIEKMIDTNESFVGQTTKRTGRTRKNSVWSRDLISEDGSL